MQMFIKIRRQFAEIVENRAKRDN